MTDWDAGRPRAGEARFAAYLDGITAVLGHASRVDPARAYCTGLLLPGERKSVEPMAARIGDHEEVCGARNAVTLSAVCWPCAPTCEAARTNR